MRSEVPQIEMREPMYIEAIYIDLCMLCMYYIHRYIGLHLCVDIYVVAVHTSCARKHYSAMWLSLAVQITNYQVTYYTNDESITSGSVPYLSGSGQKLAVWAQQYQQHGLWWLTSRVYSPQKWQNPYYGNTPMAFFIRRRSLAGACLGRSQPLQLVLPRTFLYHRNTLLSSASHVRLLLCTSRKHSVDGGGSLVWRRPLPTNTKPDRLVCFGIIHEHVSL